MLWGHPLWSLLQAAVETFLWQWVPSLQGPGRGWGQGGQERPPARDRVGIESEEGEHRARAGLGCGRAMSCGDGTVASGSLAAGSHLGHRAAVSPPEVQSSSTLSEREGSRGQAGMQLPHSTCPAGLGRNASQPWPLIQTSRSAGERVVLGLHPCFWSAVGASAAQLPTSPLDPRP